MITSLTLFVFILILLTILICIVLPGRSKNKTTYLKLKNIEELYELHNHSEVYIGQIVEVEERKYILTGIDFKTYDPWEIWKPFKEPEEVSSVVGKYNPDQFLLDNKPVPEYVKIVGVRGNNFKHRGIEDGKAIGVNIAKIPRVGNIVVDRKFVLWEVIGTKSSGDFGTLELSRSDGRHKYATLDEIYGVIICTWDVKIEI